MDLTPKSLARIYDEMRCPVCGFRLDFKPWDGPLQSDEICSGCGIQFGNDDHRTALKARIELYASWRQRWIENGRQWWSSKPKPDFWDPESQLLYLESTGDRLG